MEAIDERAPVQGQGTSIKPGLRSFFWVAFYYIGNVKYGKNSHNFNSSHPSPRSLSRTLLAPSAYKISFLFSSDKLHDYSFKIRNWSTTTPMRARLVPRAHRSQLLDNGSSSSIITSSHRINVFRCFSREKPSFLTSSSNPL